MLSPILANILLLSQLLVGAQTVEPRPPAPPTTQAASASAALAPSAQVQDPAHYPGMGELFRGKEKLTVDDLKDPGFWIGTISDLRGTIVTFIPQLMVAFAFLIIFWLIYRALRRVVLGSLTKTNMDPSIRDMLGHLLKWAVMGFGLVIACNQIGIKVTALLTGVSLVGLVVGFAALKPLANFIAGVVIFWDKPFKVGDWVTVDGVFGTVQRVTFHSTRILDEGGGMVIFPNTLMLSHKLANHSTHPINAVCIPIAISYQASIDQARQALLALPINDDRVCTTPEPSVTVKECTDSGVVLSFGFWISDESKESAIYAEYLEKAKKALDANSVEFPLAHLRLVAEATSVGP